MMALGNRNLKRAQSGVALIESLVAMAILAVGVLGLVGFQLQVLRDTRDSVGRARAIVAIQDITERMRLNSVALTPPPPAVSPYNTGFAALPAPATNCTAAVCTVAQLAAFDLWRWKQNVAMALPGGQAAIQPSANDARQYAVMVGWRENATDQATGEANRLVVQNTLVVGGASGLVCPAGLTCHLSYVQPFR